MSGEECYSARENWGKNKEQIVLVLFFNAFYKVFTFQNLRFKVLHKFCHNTGIIKQKLTMGLQGYGYNNTNNNNNKSNKIVPWQQ